MIEKKKSLLLPDLAERLWIGILTLLLLFLPFQVPIWSHLKLPDRFLWIDEAFIIFVLVLSLLVFLNKGKAKRGSVQILFCLICLGTAGIVSGLVNGNRFAATANGTFDYIKNFLIIPVLSLLAVSERRVMSIYKILYGLALFFCLVALVQEIAFFLGLPVQKIGVSFFDVRFGLLRTPSLMWHPNVLGLNSILFFILDFNLHQRIRWQNLLLVAGVFLSVSRTVWIAFFISLLYLFVLGRSGKKFFLFVTATVIIGIAAPSFYFFTTKEMGPEGYFRGYALDKSLRIFEDHPVWGVGPGMYGGVVSLVLDSPVYRQYNFSEHWLGVIRKNRSLDQFWPQILAEMGLSGTILFGVLLFKLWQIAKKGSFATKSPSRKKMLMGLSAVPVVLAVYLFGSGLNLTPFLLTYGILFGMTLGMKDEDSSCK